MFPLEKMNNEQTKEKKDKKSLLPYGKANFSDKRQKIIAAAEDVVSEKGLREATIAEIAKAVGGSGGGRPDMAQAGGTRPEKLDEALKLARKLIRDRLEH